jgi:hypothetical protein
MPHIYSAGKRKVADASKRKTDGQYGNILTGAEPPDTAIGREGSMNDFITFGTE